MTIADRLAIAPEVAAALADGRPVVALESTLISHGLPYPQNVEVARASESAVRATGAVPATVAIREGRIIVGLDEASLETLARARNVRKAARPSLSAALAGGGWAATTVSATMIAAHAAGIGVFATGGIGGVHRGALGGGRGALGGGPGARSTANVDDQADERAAGAHPSFDISSDLEELARTPVTVVCAGPKAILDVAATIEYLETRGVPVLVVGSDQVPGFYCRESGVAAPEPVADIAAAARIVATQRALGLGCGVLVCAPVPAAEALPFDVARAAIEQAVAEAERAAIGGPALTPWLLGRIATLTDGASIRANTALIINDARVAGELAGALASGVAAS